jgi:hypothetical protein
MLNKDNAAISTPIRPSGSLSHPKKFLIMHAPVTRFVLAPAANTLDYSTTSENTDKAFRIKFRRPQ